MSIFSKLAKQKLKAIEEQTTKKGSEIKRQITLDDIDTGQFALDFVKFIESRPRTERNILFNVRPWHRDYALIFGDLRVQKHVVSGSAQVVKSLGAFLLTYYSTELRNLSILFTFAKAGIRNKLVASTVKPLYEYNRENQNNPKELLVDNTSQMRSEDYTLYTSFTNNPQQLDSVAVPPELASISVDIVIVDEFQQSQSDVVAVLSNRMNASSLESNPEYYLSTPGSTKTGIDLEMSKCDKVFEAHVHCKKCNRLSNLNPLKSFLKPSLISNNDGEEVEKFYDASYRVLGWYHDDPENPVDSAYIACEHCQAKISQEQINAARYFERDSKMSAEAYHKEVNSNPYKYRSVGLMVNPFLKNTKSYIAPRIAREAMTTDNTKDFLQQKLGIATSSDTDGISHESLQRTVEAPNKPVDEQNYNKVRLMGIDLARGSHYGAFVECYIPKEGSNKFKYDNTIRVIKEFPRISTPAVVSYARENQIEFGAIDLNPDQSLAIELCDELDWLPVLQKKSFKEVFRTNNTTENGGIAISNIDIDNQYFLNRIVSNFARCPGGQSIYVLPDTLRKDLNDPSKSSPIFHFKAFEFDAEKGLWQKPANKSTRCDSLYALLFAEVALYGYIFNHVSSDWLKFYT